MSRGMDAHALSPVAALGAAELAIARSVLYASLFDYPVTLAQLRQTLIECSLTPTQILSCVRDCEALTEIVSYGDGFFFPAGREDLVEERTRREARSRQFLRRHRLVLALISSLPYVRMVALSGSVAHLNLEGDGDLDLFLIVRGRRVWMTAVAVVLLAKLMQCRRILCANFILADSHLSLEQQDLFTASQVIHLKPLIGSDVYARFVDANPFVRRLYPNFHPAPAPWRFRRSHPGRAFKRILEVLLAPVSAAAERACRVLYRSYLLHRASSWSSPAQVRLEPDCLKLHTQSHRQSVLERFDDALKGFRL